MESPLQCPSTVTIRRNPHRNARPTPSSTRAQIPTTSSSSAAVSSFPIHEILSMDVPVPISKHHKLNFSDDASENLRVFLRIRPLVHSKCLGKTSGSGESNPRSKGKNVWPQRAVKKSSATQTGANTKKRSSELCISVNDSHSVTLAPPVLLPESKRIKSEVYEGFSYVFSPESSQV